MKNNFNYLCIMVFLIQLVLPGKYLFSEDKVPEITALYGTGGRICASPIALGRGRSAVFSEDRYLYLFDNNSRLIERNRLPGTPSDYIASGHDGIVYAFFPGGRIKALNIRGQVLWSMQIDGLPAGKPVINIHGNIFAADDKMNIYSWSMSGRLRWKAEFDSEITYLSGSGDTGFIIAGFKDKRLKIINNSGNTVKTLSYSSEPAGAALSANHGYLYTADKEGYIYSYNLDFDLLWKRKISASIRSIHAQSSILLAVTERGGIAALSKTSDIIFEKSAVYRYTGKPVITEKYIYMPREGGFTDRIEVTRNPGKSISIPVPANSITGFGKQEIDKKAARLTGSGQRLVYGGQDWIVYFIDTFTDMEKTDSASAFFQYDFSEEVTGLPGNFIIYLGELYRAGGYENYSRILALVDTHIKTGRLKASEEAFLLDMLGKIFQADGISGSALVKSRAAALVSETGTHGSIALLRQLLMQEKDPYVISSIIKALGNPGSDPAGESVRLFSRAAAQQKNDERIMRSITDALLNIHNYHGYIPSEEALPLLLKMLDNAADDVLKLNIMNALKEISRQEYSF